MASPAGIAEELVWIRQESERRWANGTLNPAVYGFQVQPGTRWRPGLPPVELTKLEAALGYPLPEVLQIYYRTMNGVTLPGINLFGGTQAPSFSPIYYGYPSELVEIKAKIQWIYDSFSVTEPQLREQGISRIFPIYSHRFLLLDHPQHPVLSMYGDDVIPYACSLTELLRKEALDEDISDSLTHFPAEVRFWVA